MLNEQLSGVFAFMSKLYAGNWVYRWAEVPFVEQKGDTENGKGESILGHQYACMTMWSLLQRILPATSQIIDSQRVADMLMFHDIGEIGAGDMPLVVQLTEGNESKTQLESTQIDTYSQLLPTELNQWVRQSFRDFTFNERSKEVLMARHINALQGNHFALTYGKDLESHTQLIQKIVNRFFMPISSKLTEELDKVSREAGKEINTLTQFHLESIRAKNIQI